MTMDEQNYVLRLQIELFNVNFLNAKTKQSKTKQKKPYSFLLFVWDFQSNCFLIIKRRSMEVLIVEEGSIW